MRPTTLEKLKHSNPVLAAVVATAPDREKRFFYRIQFAVDRIKPKDIPPFPYVTSKVFFDCLVYTAIVQGSSLADVVAQVRRYWPDAQPRLAEENRGSFDAEDSCLASMRFGSVTIPNKRSVFDKLKLWRKE